MRSARLCAALAWRPWLRAVWRASAAHNAGDGSEVGEPVEQAGVLVPLGQVTGDDALVGGFEGLALGLGRGSGVDLGGGQVDVPEDVADVGQRHSCLVEV